MCILGESLGGVETLIAHPATMSHAAIGEEGRKAMGISDGVLRLSVGLEDVEDIIADLDQALECLFNEVLRETRWVLGGGHGAAARLGMPRTTLVYRMRKLGIARDQGAEHFRAVPAGCQICPPNYAVARRNHIWPGPKEYSKTRFHR